MTKSIDRSRKKRSKAEGTVIHVAFGAGGGRVPLSSASPSAPASKSSEAAPFAPFAPNPANAANVTSIAPVSRVFTRRDVAKLLHVSESRLRALDKQQIVCPSGTQRGRPAYTFQDLIALRATRELLAKNVTLRDVATAIGALKTALPRVTRPLQELRIVSDGRRVVVRTSDGTFEPVTGQMVMDFEVDTLCDDVVRVLAPKSAQTRARTAYDLYMQASGLDEDPATFDEAAALYKKAIALDPTLSIAYTNLGNICFRRGDDAGAEDLYRRALDVDESQPEAHYNLGYVLLERGQPATAITFFERAIGADGRFADAHFNIAMALEQVGQVARARPHWMRYLEIEPKGTWAEIARQHL